jgi:DNA-binding CsgD family transcriptional regulator
MKIYYQMAKRIKVSQNTTPEILQLVKYLSYGHSAKEAAIEFGYNQRTVESNISTLKKRFNCINLVHLVAYFLRNKLIK